MTDSLGSILASFTNMASAALKGNQVYGPYGKQRYHSGSIGTPKGFTGQYNDSLTVLDYYRARYYDPVAGVFLSADTVQGNPQGMNPYAYVNGNPETWSDPTGQVIVSSCYSQGCGISALPQPSVESLTSFPGLSEVPSSSAGGGPSNISLTSGANTADVTSVATGAKPSLYSGGSVQQLSSCGLSQALCGHYGVNFAVYFGGFQLSVPGEWCVECGQPGGSDNGGGSGENSNLSAASNTEGVLSNPPDGWEIADYGSDNKAEIVDFTHTDESGNTLEASLYREPGELQISWMDLLRQAKIYLPGLVNWLGDSVQTVKGYATDNFATYFSPESRGVTLVNRMFSSVLEEAGFTQGTIELEGSKIWFVFRRIE